MSREEIPKVIIYGPTKCIDCDRIKGILQRRNVEFTFFDIESDWMAERQLRNLIEMTDHDRSTPRILFGLGEGDEARVIDMLVNPKNPKLNSALDRHGF